MSNTEDAEDYEKLVEEAKYHFDSGDIQHAFDLLNNASTMAQSVGDTIAQAVSFMRFNLKVFYFIDIKVITDIITSTSDSGADSKLSKFKSWIIHNKWLFTVTSPFIMEIIELIEYMMKYSQ